MFDFHDDFSIAAADDKATKKRAEELATAKELYRFYQDYLAGIPTLFNAKLGDHIEGVDVSFSVGPHPETLHETMLSHDQLAAIDEMIAGERPVELLDDIADHPAFSEDQAGDDGDGDDASFGLFSQYDGQTGVPKPEVPPLRGYLLPRGLFNKFNAGVSKRLREDPPSLQGPSNYQVLYDAYLADSKKPLRDGKKVLGFDGFADLYDSDAFFAWQRIAGTNPRVLMQLSTERLADFRAKMQLTDAHVAAVAGEGATVSALAAQGRLYYCDYALLAIAEVQQGRYLAPAIGVFLSDPVAALKPVAIQLQQTPGRVYTPDQSEWVSARAYFQSADFNYHEMGTHLSEAHFAQEAFAIAMRRNLSATHPIGALLSQIYFALLYNNALGRMQLVNPGGYADKMMAGDLTNGSLKLVREYYHQVWRWDDWDLDLYLARQGTNDAAALPVYPYRDDGLPVWAAIKAFVGNYVDAYYDRDAVVANDRELTAFAAELNDPNKGNMATKGFPAKLLTKADLTSVVARLMWQAGPGHAGINYSQYQYFAPIANAPGATYADFAVEGSLPGINEVLPPIEQAITQDDIFNVLTQKVFGTLGTYDDDFHCRLNDGAKNAVKRFQTALAQCTAEVDQRNATDVRKDRQYPFMNPINLPNSTNI